MKGSQKKIIKTLLFLLSSLIFVPKPRLELGFESAHRIGSTRKRLVVAAVAAAIDIFYSSVVDY